MSSASGRLAGGRGRQFLPEWESQDGCCPGLEASTCFTGALPSADICIPKDAQLWSPAKGETALPRAQAWAISNPGTQPDVGTARNRAPQGAEPTVGQPQASKERQGQGRGPARSRVSEEGNPAGLSSCSGGLRPLVELCVAQKSPDTPGSLEGNTEGPGTASSEPLLPS